MPQKKNPDALELIRGKAARLQGNLVTLQAMVKNLPLTYNRDLQEDKPPLFDSFRTLRDCLDVLADLIPGINFREERCRAAVSDPLLLATDLADYLVEQGVPFRQAHHQVGALVALSEKLDTPINDLPEGEARKAAEGLSDGWRDVFSLERGMARRTGPGMPGPEPVRKAIASWKQKLASG
jgi:argininosuccinate lyase